jgi:Protein of unknown function (DUF3617)
MHHSRSAAAAVFCAASIFAAGASAAPLNVKLGLWEVTLTTQMSGGGLPFDVSKLTPEQQAQARAILQSQNNLTHTYKSCVTKKQLEEDPAAEPPEEGEKCTTKIASQSSTHWKGTRICTRNGRRREFDVDMRAVSRERTQGTVRAVFNENGDTMTVNNKMSSRWLSSDCGSVK